MQFFVGFFLSTDSILSKKYMEEDATSALKRVYLNTLYSVAFNEIVFSMVMHTLQVSFSGLNALTELLEIEKLKINSRVVVQHERNSFWLQLSSSAVLTTGDENSSGFCFRLLFKSMRLAFKLRSKLCVSERVYFVYFLSTKENGYLQSLVEGLFNL